ncbi:MAG: hypothetical protein ACKPKO_25840, partial [Candidatus Fonsibacter sp.]
MRILECPNRQSALRLTQRCILRAVILEQPMTTDVVIHELPFVEIEIVEQWARKVRASQVCTVLGISSMLQGGSSQDMMNNAENAIYAFQFEDDYPDVIRIQTLTV